MSTQHKSTQHTGRRPERSGAGTVEAPPPSADDEIISLTEDLLDEIDELLEDQSVLVSYRQKPGQ